MQRKVMLPSHALGSMERSFGRLFEDLVGGNGRNGDDRPVHAAMDLVEAEEAWTLTVDLPGVAEADVQLTLEDGVLELKAERAQAELKDGEHARHRERPHGVLGRRLRLPGEVDGEAIEA
ncbi:MAG: Hsp20/alpha crystallin family protein, partial [Planctomycetota bacterium]|nr:Hsp20/alpha crystallin family protein [Planctomycetota bacterium]